MKRPTTIFVGVVTAVFSFALYAEAPGVKTITRADDPLVRELEASYTKYVTAVHTGDLATFRSFRTAKANQEIPPNATDDDLKGMADFMAPKLDGYTFLQLDTKNNQARAAYKLEKQGELIIRVLMFEREGGGWKMGDVHEPSYIGRIPPVADALKAALKAPLVQFR